MIAQNLQLQRIYSYYKQQLNSISGSNIPKAQTLNKLISSSTFSTSFRKPPVQQNTIVQAAPSPAIQLDCAMDEGETTTASKVEHELPVVLTKPDEMKDVAESVAENNDQEMEVVVSENLLVPSDLSNGSKSPNMACLSNLPSVSQQEKPDSDEPIQSVENPMESDEIKPETDTTPIEQAQQSRTDEEAPTPVQVSVEAQDEVIALPSGQEPDKVSENGGGETSSDEIAIIS